MKQLAQCQEDFLSQTQEHLKLKEEFTKIGKSELIAISYTDLAWLSWVVLLHHYGFLQISPLDDELKTVREKNREYESTQERLSSEQVRQTKSACVSPRGLLVTSSADVKATVMGDVYIWLNQLTC